MAPKGESHSCSVRELPGVGPERAAQLARLGIETVGDLLEHRPRRYEDRRSFRPIEAVALGEAATMRGKVVAMGAKRVGRGRKSLFELVVDDGTARLHCRWWNQAFMQNYFRSGEELILHGKLTWLRPRTVDHPETEAVEGGEENLVHMNRIVPVYPLTEGLPQRWLRSLIWRTLATWEEKIIEPHPELGLDKEWPRRKAIRLLHFPEAPSDPGRSRERLALDELVELQLAMQRRRQRLQATARGLPCAGDNRLIRPFLAGLGFGLTPGQTEVLRELRLDLGGRYPMRRLLQGDVGAGKTVVAACSALMTMESGFNVVLMAPTEVLAEQHCQTFRRWFDPLGVGVRLWTGSRKPAGIDDGQLSLPVEGAPVAGREPLRTRMVVGTHALIQENFSLERLGLVIIDEQHKFGVAQRETLLRKGQYPHLLVMTATPIPRTLGLTIYGDLDLSVIREQPRGRGRVKTYVRGPERLPRVWQFVRQKLGEGRQAYVVYPRVEEGDGVGTKALLGEAERLAPVLAPHRVGILHGRLSGEEKERLMEGFRLGQIQVLLATSVIEVGIDVPNATVMVVENAGQFGLAQLHQLRGRIGRGAHDSHCILVGETTTPEARRRLQVLAETQDGFRIAEEDLRLRGPGDLLGQDQSGLARFRFADLSADLALVERGRALAARLLAGGGGRDG